MPFQINALQPPTTFLNTGDAYVFSPTPIVAIAGDGSPVTSPYSSLTMHWAMMLDADYEWVVTTLLAGASSAVFTGTTQLYNHLKVLTTYSNCRVLRPGPHGFRYGYHTDVTLQIMDIT